MFCFRVRKYLIPYIEKTLDERRMRHIREHLHKCPKCSEEVAFLSAATKTVRASRAPSQEPAADLWSRIEAQISAPAPAVTRFPARAWQFIGASAAVAAVLVGLVVLHVHDTAQPGHKLVVKPEIVKKPMVVAQLPEVDSKKLARPHVGSYSYQAPQPKFPRHNQQVMACALAPRRSDSIVLKPKTVSPGVVDKPVIIASSNLNDQKLGSGKALVMGETRSASAATSPSRDSFAAAAEESGSLKCTAVSPAAPIDALSFGSSRTEPNAEVAAAPSVSTEASVQEKRVSTAEVLASRRLANAHLAQELPKTSVDMLNLVDDDSRNSAVFGY